MPCLNVRSKQYAQAAGGKGSFWSTKEAAEAATNRQVEIVKVDNALAGLANLKQVELAILQVQCCNKTNSRGFKKANGITEGFLVSTAKVQKVQLHEKAQHI